jgi:gamma-tubulin complex component 4
MVFHEVLLAMLGKGGTLVKATESGMKVSEEIDFLLEHERVLVERAAACGCHFSLVESFAQQALDSGKQRLLKEGLYLRALAAGLEEVLDVYRSMVLSCEQAVLADPALPLTYLTTRFSEFELLLPALTRMIEDIAQKRVHGCLLLDLVSLHASSGVPCVRACMDRFLGRLGLVLFSQVGAWVLHGMLTDPNSEFFVSPLSRGAEGEGSDGEGDEAHLSLAEDQQFEVCPERKPQCISAAVVEKVLFCGVALRIMMHPNASKEDRPEESMLLRFGVELRRLAAMPVFHRASFETFVNDMQSYVTKRLWRLVVMRARLPQHLRAVKDYFLLSRGDLYQAFIDNTRGIMSLHASDTAEHDINEPFRRAALLSYADDDEMFARTRLVIDSSVTNDGDAKDNAAADPEREGLDVIRMSYDMEWPLGTLLFTPDVMGQYNALFSFLLRVKHAHSELQYAWLQTQSGRHGRAINSQRQKQSESGKHLIGMWALRSEMAFLVGNLLYYLQCDVIDAQYDQLKRVVKESEDFEAIRLAHSRFLSNVAAECLMRNKLAWQTVNKILKIALKYARSMCRWKEVESGVIEQVFPPSLKTFRLSHTAAGIEDAYTGFPITINGESHVVIEYSADRILKVSSPLKTSLSGDLDACSDDLLGAKYSIMAPSVSPADLAEIRQMFRRNALLLFTVLKTSQMHTTAVLSQLLFRIDFNRFFEQQQQSIRAAAGHVPR